MSGQVVGFSRSEHQRTLEVLPWFVNSTLAPGERRSVEQHLAECAACRRELDALREFSDAYRASDLPVDAEGALERLRPRLAQPTQAGNAGGAPRRSRWNILIGGFLAAQFGLIVALSWALLVAPPAPSTYVALGAASAPLRTPGDAIVAFASGVDVDTMQGILNRVGAKIVDGPLATGGYVIRLDGRDVAAAVEQLRADPAVRLAARLDQVPRQ